MPFSLKNAGATYQWLVNRVFDLEIGKLVEVYFDDMLVKSATVKQHLKDLHQTFNTLRQHRMILNPLKCTFGVEAGKYLGYMIYRERLRQTQTKFKQL